MIKLNTYLFQPDGSSIDKYMKGSAKGHHGYDNAEEDMHGIFLAMGPGKKINKWAVDTETKIVYPYM